MNHKTIFIGGFALLHFGLTVVLFITSFSLSMSHFDSVRAPTVRETVLERLSELFLFPFLPLSRWLGSPFAGPGDWLLVFANSLLWGVVAYHLVVFFRRRNTVAE